MPIRPYLKQHTLQVSHPSFLWFHDAHLYKLPREWFLMPRFFSRFSEKTFFPPQFVFFLEDVFFSHCEKKIPCDERKNPWSKEKKCFVNIWRKKFLASENISVGVTRASWLIFKIAVTAVTQNNLYCWYTHNLMRKQVKHCFEISCYFSQKILQSKKYPNFILQNRPILSKILVLRKMQECLCKHLNRLFRLFKMILKTWNEIKKLKKKHEHSELLKIDSAN